MTGSCLQILPSLQTLMSREEDLYACECGWKGRGNGQGRSVVLLVGRKMNRVTLPLFQVTHLSGSFIPCVGKRQRRRLSPLSGTGHFGSPGLLLDLVMSSACLPTTSLFGSISLRIWRTAAVALWPRGPGGVSHCGQGRRTAGQCPWCLCPCCLRQLLLRPRDSVASLGAAPGTHRAIKN